MPYAFVTITSRPYIYTAEYCSRASSVRFVSCAMKFSFSFSHVIIINYNTNIACGAVTVRRIHNVTK